MQLTQTVTVVRLSAEVLTADSLQTVERSLEAEDAPVLHLDLGDVGRPTAEGLGALVVLNRELRARGGALVLFNVPAAVYEVFLLTHLVELLAISPSWDTEPPIEAKVFSLDVKLPSSDR